MQDGSADGTIHPWERRPRAPHGDESPDPIYHAVGLALTLWETIEGSISVAYVGLLLSAAKYRENGYFKNPSFEARHGLVQKAIKANVNGKDCSGFSEFMATVLQYSPRRHDIAHGRVFNLSEHGFYLGPNNTLARNYPNGAAAYQYTSGDIAFFCNQFETLALAAEPFARRLARR